MYSVNGVALDNSAKNWWLDRRTRSIADLTRDVGGVSMPGTDGIVPTPATTGAPMWPITMRIPRSRYQELVALFAKANSRIAYTATPARSVGFTLAGVSVVDENFVIDVMRVTIVLRLDGAYWRDTSDSTTAAQTLDSASVAVTGLYPGISAPVQDVQIRIKGSTTGILVTDSGGSWFSYAPALTTGQYLLFTPAVGKAVVGSNPASWDDYDTDVSGVIDFGGPRGVFELTPYFSSDPATRDARLTVTTTTRSGANIQIRGRGAYVA